MYILHIETATNVCSVALSRKEEIIGLLENEPTMDHASILVPMIEDLAGHSGLSMAEMNAVAVSSGPGSYTGLRVGGATAKAISYSLGIPLLPVPTLWSLATAARRAYPDADAIVPMIDARRNEVYSAVYGKDAIVKGSECSVLIPEDLDEFLGGRGLRAGKMVFCGNGAFKMAAHISRFSGSAIDPDIRCSAAHLVYPALEILSQGVPGDGLHFVPNYLKPPNITQPKKWA